MGNDTTRLLATVSALGLSLGVAFDPALAAANGPGVTAPPPAATRDSVIKKGKLHVRKAGGDQASGRVAKVEALSIKQKVQEAPPAAKDSATPKAQPDRR